MVSTRGVKFKFTEGEKVLCYEPDPTKAKVLYDSKVLELVVVKDNKGRKMPEYLIHFSGWNSSWDRCVAEEFILPDTEENRELQKKLAEEAAIKLFQAGKARRRKLPAIIKESLNKKLCPEVGKEKSDSSKESDESSTESESSEEEEEISNEFELTIPSVLKDKLEDDCYLIKRRNKLVKLPCEVNVVALLEAYLKHFAVNLLCAAPPKSNKQNNQQKHMVPADVETKLKLCKEVMDGLRIYFNFTLSGLLLYNQEQKQHSILTTKGRPLCAIKNSLNLVLASKIQYGALIESVSDVKEELEKTLDEIQTKTTASEPVTSPTSRGRPRKAAAAASHQHAEVSRNSQQENTKGTRTRGTASPEKASQAPPVQRSLRSQDRRTSLSSSRVESDVDSSYHKSSGERSKISGSSPQHSTNATQGSTGSLQRAHVPAPLNLTKVPSISSSASSTHSSISTPTLGGTMLADPAGVLNEVLSWRMVPEEMYSAVPASPSLLYGAHHLLRLFVRLPHLVQKMNMTKRKLVHLEHYLTEFLKYVAERHDELLPSSAYGDADELYRELDTVFKAE